MKKKFRSFLLIISSIAFSFGLSSCSDDGYSLGDFYASLVTVNKDSKGNIDSFTLENGQTLFISASETKLIPKNERAVINYTILADNFQGYDYAIKLNGYHEDVLTKPIIYVAQDDKEEQDKIGYDKIKVASIWAKSGYITIRFAFNMGGKDAHSLNMVALDENKEQQGTEPIKLQFRHNKNQDIENYGSGHMHVSFKLDKYIVANSDKDEVSFEVSWTEYSGEEKKQILKYAIPKVEIPAIEEKME